MIVKPVHQFITVLILSVLTFYTLHFGLSPVGVIIRPIWWVVLIGVILSTLSDVYIIGLQRPKGIHPQIDFVRDNQGWCLTLDLFYFILCYLNLTVQPQLES